MNFRNFLADNIVYLDGGMGTLLQANGLKAGDLPERWNVSHPEIITKIHKDYYLAGSNVQMRSGKCKERKGAGRGRE